MQPRLLDMYKHDRSRGTLEGLIRKVASASKPQ